MKKTKIMALILGMALTLLNAASVTAAEIPRESLPIYASQDAANVASNLISGTLDKVKCGMSYADARIETNNAIFAAVINNQTKGYGYGILTEIANNAIYEYRDLYLRPEYYAKAEETVKALISDLIVNVASGTMTYDDARKAAYTRIYQTVDPLYNPNDLFLVDVCYWDIPSIDSAMFNRARKLLLEAVPNAYAE